ncbi:MAG: MogA/MoaB family molybdenum cofactor biosynthesis protein [Thermoguttaceae bacterium]
MSHVPDQHRAEGPQTVRCAVITVSDTRTLQTDASGRLIVELLTAGGHQVVQRHILRDEPGPMRTLLETLRGDPQVDVILMTGGTGLGSRDQTFETVSSLLDKTLPGYGELFRVLSFQQIGAAAMMSRAVGGLLGRKVVLTMPGSKGGVQLAMERLILPELGHLVREANR